MIKSKREEVLIYGILLIWLAGYIVNVIVIKKYNDIKTENARMEQQIIDYRWQLEETQMICEKQLGD